MVRERLFITAAQAKAWAAGLALLTLAGGSPHVSGAESYNAEMTERERKAQIATGREIYGRCKGCHSFGFNRVGPDHCGIAGRKAGAVPGYRYSSALRSSNMVWTQETLDAFLFDPRGVVPGTKMTYDGVKNDRDRGALVAYILDASLTAEACR